MVITSSTPLISIAFIVALFFLLHPSHSSPSLSSTGLVVVGEDKGRLGSRPPRCEKRCNMCQPCMAVQVPTTPSRGRADHPSSDSEDQNRYSNYKPLGWKCRCQGHFYNP